MDSKLYKTLKQLVKLGIITKNTKVVRRRKKRTVKGKQVQQYSQPTEHLRSNSVVSFTPTIQSEQAIINLKNSELQLQQALKNKDLPDDSKKKVILAIEDIKNELTVHKSAIKNAYNNLDSRLNMRNYNNYSVDELYESDEQNDKETRYEHPADELIVPNQTKTDQYDQFVPQIKPISMMSPMSGMKMNIPTTTSNYITPKKGFGSIKWMNPLSFGASIAPQDVHEEFKLSPSNDELVSETVKIKPTSITSPISGVKTDQYDQAVPQVVPQIKPTSIMRPMSGMKMNIPTTTSNYITPKKSFGSTKWKNPFSSNASIVPQDVNEELKLSSNKASNDELVAEDSTLPSPKTEVPKPLSPVPMYAEDVEEEKEDSSDEKVVDEEKVKQKLARKVSANKLQQKKNDLMQQYTDIGGKSVVGNTIAEINTAIATQHTRNLKKMFITNGGTDKELKKLKTDSSLQKGIDALIKRNLDK